MSISDADFLRWCKQDNKAQRVCTIEIDYQDEDGGEPITSTLLVSDRPYRLGNGRYYAIVQSVPEFYRTLGGERHGVYSSSYGSIVLVSRGGEFDWLLDAAIDGSDARFRYGDIGWPIADHRLMFSAKMVGVQRADVEQLEIHIQDTGILLNKSISGQVLIGGTGPNADKPRSFNFGLVRQAECSLVDLASLTWAHSDTGENTLATDVQVRLESVGFTDNADGTVTLDASPPTSGVVTATVIATNPAADPSDPTAHLVSDLMDVAVGSRSGLSAAGLYAGAHATFVVGDDQDYPIGVSVTDTRNTIDFLTDLCASGQCSWAITRDGFFTYLRIRPNDVATLPMTPFEIRKQDVFFGEGVTLEHDQPGYYRIQAICDKNWKLTDDVAGDVINSEQYAIRTRKGVYLEQDDAVGDTYADRPELYDLTLVESPIIETWISGDGDDASDSDILASWMEVERFNGLPWLERVTLTVGIEFFDKELGDVANLTFDRFGYDAGELAQVIGIRLMQTDAKIQFTLLRRRLSQPYPEGWVRTTTTEDATTESSFIFDSVAPPTVVPPPLPPPILPPWWPGDIVGAAGYGWANPFLAGGTPEFIRVMHARAQVQSFDDFNRSVAMDSTGTIAAVGVANDYLNVGTGVNGSVQVWERAGGGGWSLTATLAPTAINGMIGYTVSIADDATIVASEYNGQNYHVWTRTGPTTWSHANLNDTSVASSTGANAVINRDGTVIAVVGSYGDTKVSMWKLVTGTWTHQQTINVSLDTIYTVAISADGGIVATSGADTATPANLNVRVFGSGDLSTWTQNASLTPISDNGNTRAYRGQQIALSADKSVLAVVAPNDQDGSAVDGTVFIFSSANSGVSYAQDAYIRSESLGAGTYLGIGSVALSDNGGRLFVADTYYTGSGHYGRLWYVDNPKNLSGITYMIGNAAFTDIVNPYGPLASQLFGEALSCSGNGKRLVVASGDFGDTGTDTLDFFEETIVVESFVFRDTFTGSGTIDAHTSDSGHTYTGTTIVWSGSYTLLELSGGLLTCKTTSFGTGGATVDLNPASADYFVEADCVVDPTTAWGTDLYIGLRVIDASSDGYMAEIWSDNGGGGETGVVLWKADFSAQLGTATLGAGTNFTLRIEAQGSVIKLLVDGVALISVFDTTSASAGKIFLAQNKDNDSYPNVGFTEVRAGLLT